MDNLTKTPAQQTTVAKKAKRMKKGRDNNNWKYCDAVTGENNALNVQYHPWSRADRCTRRERRKQQKNLVPNTFPCQTKKKNKGCIIQKGDRKEEKRL